jgi:hypothetical protein
VGADFCAGCGSFLLPLRVYAQNVEQAPSLSRLVIIGGSFCLLGLVVAAVFARPWGWARGMMVGAVTVTVLSWWARLTDVGGFRPDWILPPVFWGLFVGVTRSWGFHREFAAAVAVSGWFALISSGLPMLQIGASDAVLAGDGYDLGPPSEELRDLIVVVLDGYGGSQVLAEMYEVDNSSS